MDTKTRGKASGVNLRLQYPKILEMSLIIAIAMFVIAFKFLPEWGGSEQRFVPEPEVITLDDIVNTKQEEEHPPPPARPPILVETLSGDILDDLVYDWTELDLGEIVPRTRIWEEEADEGIFDIVEDMPVLIGGVESIMQRIRYPEFAIRSGIEGTVFVRAYVSAEGKVFKTELVNDPGGGLGRAAEEAVWFAEFIPGKQRDQPVAVRVVIPVHFRLHR